MILERVPNKFHNGGARYGPKAVGRDRHGTDPVPMGFERAQCLAIFQVPHSQRLVTRGRHGQVPIGRYHHVKDALLMAFERPNQRTSGRGKTRSQRPKPRAMCHFKRLSQKSLNFAVRTTKQAACQLPSQLPGVASQDMR